MSKTFFTLPLSAKAALYVLAVSGGCAFAGSAMAQSMEYQRGYDAGYRDGAQAQAQADSNGRGYDSAGRIEIEQAIYGTRDRSCDATQAVQAAIGRRAQVTLIADNRLCGDPAENQVKRLSIRYHCSNEASQRVRAMEEETVSLSCR
ncbi:MAG: hypothetical protein H7315_18055 [Herminiimonas sp.]|nr:hypothetical protein [Herminiimonas sp.]